MKSILNRASLTVLSTLAAVAASAWTLSPCPKTGSDAKDRAEYADAVRRAKPDTPLYTAHPFPQTDEQVFENFLTYHTAAFSDTAFSDMNPGDQTFFSAVAEGRVHYDVIKVENWTPTRCVEGKIRSPYSVLRIYDREGGDEITRAVSDEVGHIAMVQHRQEEWEIDPVVSLDAAGEAFASSSDTSAADLQYVATWGMISCSPLHPCVVARADRSAFVLYTPSGNVYRVDGASPRLSLASDLPPEQRSNATRQARKRGQYLVSLGNDSMAAAKLVTTTENR